MEFEKLGLGDGLGTTEKKNPSSRQGRHRIWGLRIAFEHSKRSAKLPHKGMMHWDQCCFCYCLTIFGSIYVENILHVLTFATKHFLDIFLLKKSWKDRQRANGKLCWGDVGSNVFTTNNKICTLGYHITWYTLGCLCPTSELTVCIKPESVRQTPAQYNTLPSGCERQP